MRRFVRYLAALTVAGGFVWLAACGSSPTSPKNISLAGNYTLSSFTEAGTPVPFDAGTLVLTDTDYKVHITFSPGVPLPPIADSGTYVATDSLTFTETGTLGTIQGTYTYGNNVLTVSAMQQGIPVTQAWDKQ